jgi:hypothetical protein
LQSGSDFIVDEQTHAFPPIKKISFSLDATELIAVNRDVVGMHPENVVGTCP